MAAQLSLKLSVFLSAFLLFAIQPLITKHFLPFFGGSYTTWTISVFFFTSTLLIGYVYAGVAITWSQKQLFFVHGSLLCLLLVLLGGRWLSSSDTVLTEPVVLAGPALSVLLSIVYAVFIPTMLLASTSVIAQAVYERQTGKTPYPLYALSNVGSLLGLASYPFVFELLWPLSVQSIVWTIGVLLFVVCFLWALRPVLVARESGLVDAGEQVVIQAPGRIVCMAAIPTFMLASLTEFLAKGIASFPLLWVLPLMLYLISFIIIFRNRSWRITDAFVIAACVLSFLTLLTLPYSNRTVEWYWIFMVLSFVTFFVVTCYFHARVFNSRPGHRGLGVFYLLLTAGGALGSGVVGLLLPQVLNAQIELIPLLGGLTVYFLWHIRRVLYDYFPKTGAQIGLVFSAVCVVAMVVFDVFFHQYIKQQRNFYGTFSIADQQVAVAGETETVRILTSGSTVHGVEVLTGSQQGNPALSYYQSSSGVMEVFAALQEAQKPIDAVVIGLGAGALAGNCDEQTTITFVDINPLIESLAQDYFSYLTSCDEVPVHIADGRLWLEDRVDAGAQYDLIVVDAFTDDAIPVHLLTQEAFSDVYTPLLAERGIVAVHISNRYLDLRAPVFGAAEAGGMSAVFLYNEDAGTGIMDIGSQWIILGEEESVARFRELPSYQVYDGRRIVWTDGKSSILNVLQLPRIRLSSLIGSDSR